ncbi:MAG: acyl-CoA thioesterase [Candidatus Rokuibacteriota bacterium]|nr:MAG: acyl-CoA thioesterase [Candidatus Rokubacteria bacterium]
MKVDEASLSTDLQGSILTPAEPTGWGVVVLAGSSGRVDVARAKLLAGLGAVCIALRYFGGERQPPGICEVPLEVFTRATDRLIEEGCERVAYVGTVAWPQRSSWTRGGVPLPFIKYDETWRPERREGLVTYRSLYERSLQMGADDVSAATIPIEKARAKIILVAGRDDALWPSDVFAKSIEERLASAGKSATLIQHPKAGHRLLFPSETTPRSIQHAHGGSDEADAELGRSAWDAISALLRQ